VGFPGLSKDRSPEVLPTHAIAHNSFPPHKSEKSAADSMPETPIVPAKWTAMSLNTSCCPLCRYPLSYVFPSRQSIFRIEIGANSNCIHWNTDHRIGIKTSDPGVRYDAIEFKPELHRTHFMPAVFLFVNKWSRKLLATWKPHECTAVFLLSIFGPRYLSATWKPHGIHGRFSFCQHYQPHGI
jgi:hypothetical protein